MTWDECIKMLNKKDSIQGTKYIALNERTTFDLDSGEPDREYHPTDKNEIEVYIKSTLSKMKYPYEFDEMPDKLKLEDDIYKAVLAMNERLERIKIVPDMCVFIEVYGKEIPIIEVSDSLSKGNLKCKMDHRYASVRSTNFSTFYIFTSICESFYGTVIYYNINTSSI